MKEATLKNLREAQDQKALLLAMVETPGWKMFQEFMDQQVKSRRDRLELTAIDGMDSMIAATHVHAELSGLRLGAEYVTLTLTTLEDQIEMFKKTLKTLNQEKENEDG